MRGCELTLVSAGRPAPLYVGAAVANPTSLTIAALALMFGVVALGVVGGVLATSFVLAVCAGATRSPAIRRMLDRTIEQRASERREAARLKALGPAGAARLTQYVQLRDLVADIERTAPGDASRLELQELLERFVCLAISHQRVLAALDLASVRLVLPPAVPGAGSRAAAIAARRAVHRDACRRQADELEDDLEAIDQLVRLIAQRAACPPEDDDLDREIERRLCEMEQTDSAFEQLSA